MHKGAWRPVVIRSPPTRLSRTMRESSKGDVRAEFGLEMLYTEALEQWQKHVTGMRPVSASVIVCL